MKTKWFLISAFALLTGISFVSCSNDDDPPPVPEFPKSEGISVNVNETKVLTFDANMEWKLTANKSWITFMQGDAEIGPADQGAAGKNISRTIKIKDSNWGFNDETDEIKLTMGGKTEVIYTITRPGRAREAKMFEEKVFGSALEEVSQIDLIFQSENSSSTKIGFLANYDWMIEVPGEISLEKPLTGLATELDGTPESTNMAYISLKDEYVTHAYSGKIKVKDQNSDFAIEFPVEYTGMGNDDLFVTTNNRFNRFAGISFTQDGFFIEEKNGGVKNPTTEKEISFSVGAKDDKFSYFMVEINDQEPRIATDPWAVATEGENDKKVKVSIAGTGINDGAARSLYLLVLPEALVEPMNLSDYFTGGGMNPEKGNYVIKISQEGTAVAGGFIVKWGMESIPVADMDVVKAVADMLPMIGFGAPEDNTYMYNFTDDRRNGGLGVFPTGWQGDIYIYKIESILEGNWEAVSCELSNNESQGTFGLLLNDLDKVSGFAVVLFYNSPADQDANKPMGAIVLSKD